MRRRTDGDPEDHQKLLPRRSRSAGTGDRRYRPIPGVGGAPGGTDGTAAFGITGSPGSSGHGIGGGLYTDTTGTAKVDNTNITGNHASTSNDDVFGTVSM
jgi:hypothetical protein